MPREGLQAHPQGTARRGQTYSRWYIELRDHDERVRRLAAFKDRNASEELGRKLERLARLRAARQAPERELARRAAEEARSPIEAT